MENWSYRWRGEGCSQTRGSSAVDVAKILSRILICIHLSHHFLTYKCSACPLIDVNESLLMSNNQKAQNTVNASEIKHLKWVVGWHNFGVGPILATHVQGCCGTLHEFVLIVQYNDNTLVVVGDAEVAGG